MSTLSFPIALMLRGFGPQVDLNTAEVTGTLGAANGGTGVANNAAATLTRSGNHALTITTSGTANLSIGTGGTLGTAAYTAATAYATAAQGATADAALPLAGGSLTGLVNLTAANQTNSNERGILRIRSNDAATLGNNYGQDLGGSVSFGGKYSSGGGVAEYARVYGAKEGSADDAFVGYFAVAVGEGGSPTEALRITSTGAIQFVAPSSPASNATGRAGTIAWDASYIYVCTASGVWKRVALTGGY